VFLRRIALPRPSQVFATLILLTAAIPACAQTATPQNAPVSCESSWEVPGSKLPVLQHRILSNGKIEYYGRYKMHSPDMNNLECRIRQLLFNVGRLANDLPQGTPNGPVLTFVVQHGIFRCPAKDMKLSIGTQPNGPDSVLYTVDAQSATSKRGVYYAKISVIGLPPNP
jgi:hypothetical protein